MSMKNFPIPARGASFDTFNFHPVDRAAAATKSGFAHGRFWFNAKVRKKPVTVKAVPAEIEAMPHVYTEKWLKTQKAINNAYLDAAARNAALDADYNAQIEALISWGKTYAHSTNAGIQSAARKVLTDRNIEIPEQPIEIVDTRTAFDVEFASGGATLRRRIELLPKQPVALPGYKGEMSIIDSKPVIEGAKTDEKPAADQTVKTADAVVVALPVTAVARDNRGQVGPKAEGLLLNGTAEAVEEKPRIDLSADQQQRIDARVAAVAATVQNDVVTHQGS